MHLIKGFVSIANQVNNFPNQVSLLGELSTWCRTYSKEIGEYYLESLPDLRLSTFISNDSVTGDAIELTTEKTTQILSIVDAMIRYSDTNLPPFNTTDYRNELIAEFTGQLSSLNFGPFKSTGEITLPEWISWTMLADNTEIKIWLSDIAFREQYDNYEIVIIPPIEPVDALFNNYAETIITLADKTLEELNEEIQLVKDVNPETYFRINTFNLINSLNDTQSYPTVWGILIYGKAGDNIDSIKDAVVEYILERSSHTRAEWEVLMPDLFKRTEFIFLPRWDKVSIPNLTIASELYGNMIKPSEAIQFAKNYLDFLDDTFINNNIYLMPYDYKAIMLVALNGVNNVPGKQKLDELYPDYIPVSSTTLDFGRMQPATQNFVLRLGELLVAAETVTAYSSVAGGFRKITREGKLYVSSVLDNVNYLVAAKSNNE